MKQPDPSKRNPQTRSGRDGRRGRRPGTAGTFTTASRSGVKLPNEDVGWTITLEEYRREGR